MMTSENACHQVARMLQILAIVPTLWPSKRLLPSVEGEEVCSRKAGLYVALPYSLHEQIDTVWGYSFQQDVC